MSSSVEAHETHHPLEVEPEGLYVHIGRSRVRLEYVLLVAMLALAGVLAALFFALDLTVDDLERWGYAGLFAMALLRSASVVIPMPASGITFVGGGLLGSVWVFPAPIMVGLVVGIGESIGELTAYGAGYGGSTILSRRRIYKRIKELIDRRAFLTVLVMSMMPSPLFDVAGLAAGATKVPMRVFYPALLIGKVVRGIVVATAGYYSIGFIETFF